MKKVFEINYPDEFDPIMIDADDIKDKLDEMLGTTKYLQVDVVEIKEGEIKDIAGEE